MNRIVGFTNNYRLVGGDFAIDVEHSDTGPDTGGNACLFPLSDKRLIVFSIMSFASARICDRPFSNWERSCGSLAFCKGGSCGVVKEGGVPQ